MTGQAVAPALSVRGFAPEHTGTWEDLVGRSGTGTFMHTRRFISYHGDRFQDRSLLLEDRHGKIVGVFPAAQDLADPELVVSHPGLTYGGLVHDVTVRGEAMIAALTEIAGHYRGLGYRRLRYKSVPAIYRSASCADDEYALFRLGAHRYRRDLSAAIDLDNRGQVSQSRPRRRRKAEAAGVTARESWDEIADYWQVLAENLADRHGAAPVHSLAEITLLHDRFPGNILLVSGWIGNELAGGILAFLAGPVLKMQYSATTALGRDAYVMDPVVECVIDLARTRGCRYFDFGACTYDDGQTLNEGLYQFKASFGASGVIYDYYELDLEQWPDPSHVGAGPNGSLERPDQGGYPAAP